MNVQNILPSHQKITTINPITTLPKIRPQRFKKHHIFLVLSFLFCVAVPNVVGIYYLYMYANDQFSSTLAFSLRSEEYKSPLDLLGGLGQLTTSTSADSDILYEYIQSQKMVQNIDNTVDLRGIYSKAIKDPVFAYDPPGAIEDLVEYWGRMVDISFDSGTQLTKIVAKAFTPEDAQKIAMQIQLESTVLINKLNLKARKDATRYAKHELELSAERLKMARAELTQFRTSTQIIDPSTDLEGQMGLLNQLEGQLAEALITGDLLENVASSNDPRSAQAERKVGVIRKRIDAERERLAGANGRGEGTLSTLVGDFERLSIEQKFSEEIYLVALTTYNTAIAESQRQRLYLAAHIEPTLAETAQYPKRGMLGSLLTIFLLFGWTVCVLIYYSVKDRR